MGVLFSSLINAVDLTVHPNHKKQGGMSLLRSRMLSLGCVLTFLSCSCFLFIIAMSQSLSMRLFALYLIMAQAALFLILNRFVRRNIWLSATLLFLLSILIGVSIIFQAKSIYASGFIWFQVLVVPAFLLCGWRLGLMMSLVITATALVTASLSIKFGSVMPYGWDRNLGLRTVVLSVAIINILTLGMVLIYFHLLNESDANSLEQKNWLQRTARMQELLQMSSHFALKTNGPLDVLGTALHNLEEPLHGRVKSSELLGMLGPVESSVQELASVARSFSLFSRRYLEEGLEQTSFNVVLQHVDTIYNVGAVLRRARLNWNKVNPDILIYTQTAKLVMLIISVIRRAGAEGGNGLQLLSVLDGSGLLITLRYKVVVGNRKVPVPYDVDVVFDPELNQDLIQELCGELGIEFSQQSEGDLHFYQLKFVQARSQARLA